MTEADILKNILDYVAEYGKYSFGEMPFNEADSAVFSQLAYTDFNTIVTYDFSERLSTCAKQFYEIYSEEDIDKLIGISKKSAKLLLECSKARRFSDITVCHYINNISCEIDKQFSAVHFILDDGTDVAAFRGTDVTVTGVKESAMLSYMFPVPAQIEALHYFQETAMLHDGDIILCGHSKGGNLAVFAAVNCSNSLKKRLKAVYELDAPGFPHWFFDRYDYNQIKSSIRLFTPQSSVIGRMLYHDAQPTVIHSENSGLKQHQVSSWELDGKSFVKEDRYDGYSNFLSDYINELIDYISDDELELFFDTLEYLADKTGIEDFYDTKEIDIKKAIGLIDSLTTLDDGQKDKFKAIIKKASADFAREYISQKAQPYKNIISNLKQTLKPPKISEEEKPDEIEDNRHKAQ